MFEKTNFGWSKKIHAFDPSTLQIMHRFDQYTNKDKFVYTMDSIAFRKRQSTGRKGVWVGKYQMTFDVDNLTFDNLMYDVRKPHTFWGYSGNEWCWDGAEVWGSTLFYAQQDFVNKWDLTYQNMPNIPAGFDGWYRLV